MNLDQPFVLPFSKIDRQDLPIAGGKGANLGEMTQAGFPIPPGFCVTTAAFEQFMAASGLSEKLYSALERITLDDLETAREIGQQIRADLQAIPVPPEIAAAIIRMWQAQGSEHAYAVRSSATAEDLPDASFAGQQDTYLNVIGEEALLTAVRDCWISLFTDRAILYRIQNGFDHRQVALSVVVQQMVLPEVSGILFTADPVTGERHITTIDAGYGLGEALVAGLVSADLYKVDRRTYTVSEIQVADKQLAIRPLAGGGTVEETITGEARTAQVLTETQAIHLARIGEQYRRSLSGSRKILSGPWRMTCSHILQSRPITSLFPIPEEALRMAEKTGELASHVFLCLRAGGHGPDHAAWSGYASAIFLPRPGKLFDLDRDIHSQQVIWSSAERLWVNFTTLVRHPIGRKMVRAALPMIDPGAAEAFEALTDDPRMKPERGWFKFSTVRRIGRFLLPLLGRVLRTMRHPESRRDEYNQEAEALFQEVQSTKRSPFHAVGAHGSFLWPGWCGCQWLCHDAAAAAAAYRRGHGFPEFAQSNWQPAAGPDAPNVLILTRGLPHNVTTEMDLALWQTAKTIRADQASAAVFSQEESAALAEDYLAGALPEAAQTAAAQFMDQYGMRGLGRNRHRAAALAREPEPISCRCCKVICKLRIRTWHRMSFLPAVQRRLRPRLDR